MLRDAGLNSSEIHLTNVFNERPPSNDISYFFDKKAEVSTNYPPLSSGMYLKEEHEHHLTRLITEVEALNPTLIIPCGATAHWACTAQGGIAKHRGAVGLISERMGWNIPRKLVPTYHPAAVLRAWDYRVVVVADFMKAKREALFPEIRRPKRLISIEPTLTDLAIWQDSILKSEILSVDIETAKHNHITCVGFAPDSNTAYVVPFVDETKPKGNYWATLDEEIIAWGYVRVWLENAIPKLGQNFMYDLQYLRRAAISPRNCLHDTMLLHHALQPEMPKALGFLGSIYTNEIAWKNMRLKGQRTEKADE